jgi:small membrane protein
MTTFQIAAFVFLALALTSTIALRVRRRTSLRVAFAWSLLWIGAGVAIARPEITVRLANFLGIARGADLVFYIAILGMLVGFFAVYVKLRRFESEMTRIVRELALRTPKEPDGK